MSTLREQFGTLYEPIREDPEDWGQRLILADWLSDQEPCTAFPIGSYLLRADDLERGQRWQAGQRKCPILDDMDDQGYMWIKGWENKPIPEHARAYLFELFDLLPGRLHMPPAAGYRWVLYPDPESADAALALALAERDRRKIYGRWLGTEEGE